MEGYREEIWDRKRIKEERDNFLGRFKNFLILDIETVKDESMIDEISDPKVLRKLEEEENYFIPHPYHRIVAVSILSIKMDKNNGSPVLKKASFETFVSEDEYLLLDRFWSEYKKAHTIVCPEGKQPFISTFPVLITVNGKDFDMPVIKLRSLKYADRIKESFFISIYLDRFDKWEQKYPRYSYTYTNYHIDIPVDIFNKKVSLKNLCYLCGIPVKTEGDGSQVEKYFKDGQLEKIGKYCSEDVKATAVLFSFINRYFLQGMYLFPDGEEILKIDPQIKVL
jgi:predicted PolB exonuclease-like 3'-5' exonuclease